MNITENAFNGKNKFQFGLFICALAVPLITGVLSSLITRNAMNQYNIMPKPPLSPPGWVFPVVWTILYILMGVASYMVITSDASRNLVTGAVLFYCIQLIMNFFWSILFFSFSLYLASFIWLIIMWVFVVICTVYFFLARTAAGVMMLPYIVWASFAAYLNFAVYRLSITPMP